MSKQNEKIDFVITWLDGSDPAWLAELNAYLKSRAARGGGEEPADISPERFRSWDNLQYWFRGVEKFAPWVHRIHFVTWGHIPDWLDTTHPKLNIARHADYIPEKYLPTFNSVPIELNMHRIEGLQERFVYFNDDMFLGRAVSPEEFFRNGLPCDEARLYPMGRWQGVHPHMIMNNVQLINRHYGKADIRKHPGKWFNFRYPLGSMLRTASLMQWPFIPGFKDHHIPQTFLRSHFEMLWEMEYEVFDKSCMSRLRSIDDITDWVVRYAAFMEGEFSPVSLKNIKTVRIEDSSADKIQRVIRSQKYKMLCFNDSQGISDFEGMKQKIKKAFQDILPEKSSYEL